MYADDRIMMPTGEHCGNIAIILMMMAMILATNELSTGNLLSNGDFSEVESDGRPSIWNVGLGHGNTSVEVLSQMYLGLNAVEISVYTNEILVTLTQTVQLEQRTNKILLLLTFWHRTWIISSSGSVRLEFYDRSNHRITSEYIKALASNLTWTYVHAKKSVHANALSAKVVVRMFNCMGRVLVANFSLEQVDSWENGTFFVSPRSDGTMFIQWNLANNETGVARYDIYRGTGVLSALNDTHLIATVPTMTSYGKNIYESMYTDHSVRLNTIYTYQVMALGINGMIIDQTAAIIGQADLALGYHDITILIAFPRRNGVHLSWRLKARSTAKHVFLYNGIDSISNIDRAESELLGIYPVEDMKAIVSLSNFGPFLLVSDDGNEVATAKLAQLTRPRVVLTPRHLMFIREQIKQPGHAQEVFQALIKSVHYYRAENPFNYCWSARDAALLYVITRDIKYVNIAHLALNINRMNYTIYDRSAIKLRFALSTMARAQTFDWVYNTLTIEQRQEMLKDFQYAASIFSSYSGTVFHSISST